MKVSFSLIFIVLISLSSVVSSQSPFSLEVVPEKQSETSSIISWRDGNRRNFYVILTNTTEKSQRIFETWNSWGYQALSFELTLPSGEKSRVTVKPQIFTRNFPSTFTVKPKGSYVFRVTLDESWIGKPDSKGAARAKAQMKAVYALSATEESKKQGVWTGVIESDELSVEIGL